MGLPEPAPPIIRFGIFEVDLQAGELRKQGLRVKLQEKPFQVLSMLLERPGVVITREELQQRLWPDVTVDFEHSLGTAINKLRDALGDSADNPRFVETRPGRGYRFIYPVEGLEQPGWAQVHLQHVWLAALAIVVMVVVLVSLNMGGLRDKWLGRPSSGGITSLAVLPLENLSGDPGQDYFADGMTEALITELGKISALRVISRQSVMQYKGTEKTLPEIARELNVDAVVEGSVLHEGERVRISAQLFRAVPERPLWAHSYEGDLSAVLALQAEVAQTIAQEIRISLTPEEEARLTSARLVDPEAYESYLKGEYFRNKFTYDGLMESIEHFQGAIEKDPNFTLPYAGLAASYNMLTVLGALPPNEASLKAKTLLLKALEIDNTADRVHGQLGWVHLSLDWDWAAAEREFKRALALNPNDTQAHFGYAVYLSAMGRHEEALAEIERARELDPLSVVVNAEIAHLLYNARQYDQAIRQCLRAIELDANLPSAHFFLSRIYFVRQRYQEGTAETLKNLSITRGPSQYFSLLEETLSKSGWRAVLESLTADRSKGIKSAFLKAELYSVLGENEKALQWLVTALEERDGFLFVLRVDPLFDPLRSDPRFQSLLHRLNFPE